MSFDIGQTQEGYSAFVVLRFRPMSFDIGQTPMIRLAIFLIFENAT